MSAQNKRVHFAEAPVTRAISPRPQPRTPSPVFSDSSLPDSEPGPSTPPSTASFMQPLPSLKPDEVVAVHPYLKFDKYQKYTKLAWDVTTLPSSACVRKDRKGKGKAPLLPSDSLASATHPGSTYMEIQFPALPWKPLTINRSQPISVKDLLDEVYEYLQLKVQGGEYQSFPHGMQQSVSMAFYARCEAAKKAGGAENEERVKRSGLRRVDVLVGANEFVSLHPVAKDTWQFYTFRPQA